MMPAVTTMSTAVPAGNAGPGIRTAVRPSGDADTAAGRRAEPARTKKVFAFTLAGSTGSLNETTTALSGAISTPPCPGFTAVTTSGLGSWYTVMAFAVV
jgi:hypothetical protein